MAKPSVSLGGDFVLLLNWYDFHPYWSSMKNIQHFYNLPK
jgi:hypothetical protein